MLADVAVHSAFKIQAHKMFLDTNYNSVGNVLRNIYENFTECAMKYYRYMNSMQHTKQPHTSLLIGMLTPRDAVTKDDAKFSPPQRRFEA